MPMPRTALFAYGFRPFFLAAGAWAVIAMATWIAVLAHGAWPSEAMPPATWHKHEMLFGFVAAALAGFLLTAIPDWTKRRGYGGRPLALLAATWLLGRLMLAPIEGIPDWLAALSDLVFLPALLATVAPSLWKSRRLRNLPLPLILASLFVANLLVHGEQVGLDMASADRGLRLGINTMLVAVALIGGRIVPSFTGNALRGRGMAVAAPFWPWLDPAAVAVLLAVLAGDVIAPESPLAGGLALLAALLHGLRLARWHGHRTLGQPILWVLHLAYLWLPIGLGLKAWWLLGGAAIAQNWVHALTIGGFATMILAVMTRASLGHTGRAILADRPTLATYLLVTLAAVIRVFGPAAPWLDGLLGAQLAGAAWIAAFGLFTARYAPILVMARADGRPG